MWSWDSGRIPDKTALLYCLSMYTKGALERYADSLDPADGAKVREGNRDVRFYRAPGTSVDKCDGFQMEAAWRAAGVTEALIQDFHDRCFHFVTMDELGAFGEIKKEDVSAYDAAVQAAMSKNDIESN